MRVTVNGEDCDIPEGLSVLSLLAHLELARGLDLAGGPVAVEVNREIVLRASSTERKTPFWPLTVPAR